MLKYNASTLKKLEALIAEAGYQLRYEKGNFKSGSCLLEERRVIVINRYFKTENRAASIVDLIPGLDIDPAILSDESRRFLSQLQVKELALES